MLPEAAGRGQHFQVRGHSFSLYGPTVSRQITYFFPAINWLTIGFTKLFYVPSTNHHKKSNERVTQTLNFELLYVSCI